VSTDRVVQRVFVASSSGGGGGETAEDVQDRIDSHNADTTDVHGIADTDTLETQAGAATKTAAAVTTANSYTDDAFAVSGALAVQPAVTADFSLVVGHLIPVDASAGAVTGTLPPADHAGQVVSVRKADTSVNRVTIRASGTDIINSAGTSVTVALPDEVLTLISTGAGAWIVHAGAKPLPSLDARYQSPFGVYVVTDPQYGYTGGNDLYPALSAILALMPATGNSATGGFVQIPQGINWTLSQPVILKPGLRLVGAGMQNTRITGASGIFLFPATTVNYVCIEHIRLDSGNGHIFGHAPGVANAGPFYLSTIRHCYLNTTSTTASILRHHSNVDYDRVVIEDCDVWRQTGSTVPGFDIVNSGHAANENVWRNLRITSNVISQMTQTFFTTAPAIWVENTDANGYAYDNEVSNIIGENNPGGVLMALGWRGGRIYNVVEWDAPKKLPVTLGDPDSGGTAWPQFYFTNSPVTIGKSSASTGLVSKNVTVVNCGMRGGNYGVSPATYDVNLVPGQCAWIDVFSPHNNGTTGVINFDPAAAINIFNASDGPGYSGQPSGVHNFLGSTQFGGAIYQGTSKMTTGTGDPNGHVQGNPGDRWVRTDGDPMTSFYVKGSGTSGTGTGTLGWVPVAGNFMPVTAWGAHGDGVSQWDDTTAIQACLSAAPPGAVVFFPPAVTGSYYKITAPLVPNPGITIMGANSQVEIRQAAAGGYKPVFDCFNVSDVVVKDLYLSSLNPMGTTGGGTTRGDNTYMYSAGVWANGSGIRVENIRTSNLAVGVNLTATSADGATLNDGVPRTGNMVRNCEFYHANQGVMFQCQQGLRISDLYVHDMFDSSAGTIPCHAVYSPGITAAPSVDVTVTDCQMIGDAWGQAFRFDNVNGLVLANLLADTCVGLMNLVDCTDVLVSNVVSRNDQTTGTAKWALTVQKVTTQPSRLTMSGVEIQMGTDGLCMIVICDQVHASNIALYPNHSGANTTSYDLNCRGAGQVWNAVRIVNVGSVQYQACLVGAGSSYPTSDVTLRDIEVTNCGNIVDWNTAITGRNLIAYDPGAQRSIGTAHNQMDDQSGTASWAISRREFVGLHATTGGAAVTPLPACETVTRISANDANGFTINAPLIKPKPGMVHEFAIFNGSGTTMGALTWNAAWVLRSTLTSPPAGETLHIRFMYDTSSGTWRETTRSAGGGVSTPAVSVTGLTGSVAASRYVGATATGAPTTGAHLVGDYVIAQDGAVWICTVAGTPGTWVRSGTTTVIDVTTRGVVGDGSTDNYTALQALLDAAGTAQAGAELFFPPLNAAGTGRAIYCFGTTLNAKSRSGVKLSSLGSQANGTSAELRYTGTGSASAITWGSSKGFGIRGMAITYDSATYSGILLDGSLDVGHPDGVYARFERCWFGPVGAGGNLATLVCLDGTHDISFNECLWWAGNVQLLGKKTQGVSSTGGYAIRITLDGCSFAGGPALCAIKNADESWDINAVFEPSSIGKACAYMHDTGLRALGVTFRSCWAGDLTDTSQAWIYWSGDGLTLAGGRWAGNATIVRVDANNCHGISLLGVAITNAVVGYAVDCGGVTGTTGLACIGTDLSIYGTPFRNPPAGYIAQTNGGYVTIGGTVQATTVAATGTVTTPAASIVAATSATNLLSAAQASYETASGWVLNLKGTVSQNGANALLGSNSLQFTVTDVSAPNGNSSPSFYAVTVGGLIPGQTYTAFGSAKALDAAQSYRMAISYQDVSGVLTGTTYGTIVAGSTSAWTQVSVTAAAPPNTDHATITVFVWSAGGTVGDRHVFDQFQFAQGSSLVWVDPAGPASLALLPAAPASPPPSSGVALYLESGHLKAQRTDGSIVVVTAPILLTPIATKTAAYTATPGQLVPVDASGGAVTATMPAATTAGQTIVVKKIDSSVNAVTVVPAGTDVINASATTLLLEMQYDSATLVSNGAGAWIVAAGDHALSTLDLRYAASDSLTAGEFQPHRDRINGAVPLTLGYIVFTHFTADKTENINTLEMGCAGNWTGTPTLCRYGVWSVAANGDLTPITATVSDTTLLITSGITYPKALAATWAKVRGRRYALGALCVGGTTGPSVQGFLGQSAGWLTAKSRVVPQWGGRLTGQTDIPAGVILASSVSGMYGQPGFYIY
jgi:hypothetical protein